VIEALAKIYAETGGTAGLIVFGFFAVVVLSMLIVAYIALHILASVHDLKESAYDQGIFKEDRRVTSFMRKQRKYSLLMAMARRIRGK
jgi:hypothetical protein